MKVEISANQPVDPALTLALAQASVAAYADFERKPIVAPLGYHAVARWTGWDPAFFGGTEERFGLVFRSAATPSTFIFAFRGTDSDMDAFEDAFFETVRFRPSKGTVHPTDVAAGFYGIYDGRGGAMTASMRQQLFNLLAGLTPSRVYVTGHSLGSALAQLFTLDLALSLPSLWTANQTFACPMVGTSSWAGTFDAQAAQRDPERRAIRVDNYLDWVPYLPPSIFGYRPVGRAFLTSFDVKGARVPHLLARHSILNLQTVLGHAVWTSPQVFVGTFPDASSPGRIMVSAAPPATGQPGLDAATLWPQPPAPTTPAKAKARKARGSKATATAAGPKATPAAPKPATRRRG